MSDRSPSPPELWELAISAMREQGISERTARAFIGLCLRIWPEEIVVGAVTAALGKAEFKSYLWKVLEAKPRKKTPPSPQYDLLTELRPDPAQVREDYAAARDKLRAALKPKR